MAKELGGKGITVNAILPTATEGAGIHTRIEEDEPMRKLIPAFTRWDAWVFPKM